jgi:hypothetical protein
VFQAYLTTFLIEPGYEEPTKTLEQMLASDMKFGFVKSFEKFFTYTSDSTDSTILKNAVRCPTYTTCVEWATYYNNFSTILSDIDKVYMHASGTWADKNNRPILCELEYCDLVSFGTALVVSKGSPLLEFINDVIDHIVEGGIFMHIRERLFNRAKIISKLDIPTPADTYYVINIRHLQSPFYLLMLGHVLAVVCFVTEIMWHRYRSKGHGPTGTSLLHGQT